METIGALTYPSFVRSDEQDLWNRFVAQARAASVGYSVPVHRGVVEVVPLDRQRALAEQLTEEAFRNWVSFGDEIQSILVSHIRRPEQV